MSIRGLRGRLSTDNNQTADITATKNGTKVALDVNVTNGTSDGATATNQQTQITEAQSTNTKLDSVIAATEAIETNTTAGSGLATEANQALSDAKLADIRDNTGASSGSLDTMLKAQTINVEWNYYDLTYVAPGSNGEGQVETITYYFGSAPTGVQVLQLTYTYNADGNVERVERS